ncbi:DUF4293 domain-containing protein [Cyclobacterium qasimii]|uniref:DUF4293 domain-containing protein n=2 Tax=Cyclobacterium qasimii TaxID=1350429 RepID=S7VC46_9BACT|nr:DUF4293 domain-containing protein [Cyclobacterium qasimii]EPR67556.1 hypothetical protein ADICYQ_3580 [Cyclobacterium qasimii M12-11B]GEO21710.1 hypothetical protein CQA01_22440 [Cyclobacterium qasimii]
MIQRVQSVFLLLVAIAMVTSTLSPIWLQVDPMQTQSMEMTAWYTTVKDIPEENIISETGNIYIGILALLTAAIAIFSLLQYKNRKKQLLLNMINALLMGLTLGTAVYTSYKANETFNPAVGGTFLIGFYSIVFGLILNLVANRFIRKDEMLIRSVDRIR